MVQMSKLAAIRTSWGRSGSPRCAHEHLEKEYDLGAQTGDYGCLTCGESFMYDEVQAIRAGRGKNQSSD
jgi:hypothetical protein